MPGDYVVAVPHAHRTLKCTLANSETFDRRAIVWPLVTFVRFGKFTQLNAELMAGDIGCKSYSSHSYPVKKRLLLL